MTKFIAIVSGKGGVGKTTTAINLSTALASLGKDTIVLDGNLTAPNIGLYLGFSDPPSTIHDVIQGDKKVEQATYLHASGLKVIPGSIKLDALEKLDLNRLRKTYNQLKGLSETVVMDTGAGLGKETLSVMNLADEVLIVTTPELAAVSDALKSIKLAEKENKLVLGVVLNRVDQENELSVKNVETILEHPIIAIVPESKSIKQAQGMKHPVVYSNPTADVSVEFKKLAERLK